MFPLSSFVAGVLLMSPLMVTAIQQRADDTSVESLLTLVQQQAATLSALQATVASQHATIAALQSRQATVDSTLQQHAASINTVVSRLNSRVAFTAVMTHAPTTLTDSPFLFGNIVTNIGGGYNPNSGVFTAPVSGDYVFYAQILNEINSDRVDWSIVKNSAAQRLCTNHMTDNTPFYNTASCLATVHLQQGETVFVVRINTGTVINGDHWSSFSGHLISTDP